MFCIAGWEGGGRSERKERSRFRLYTVRSHVRRAGDCFYWFVRVRAALPACWLVRAGRSLTIRVLQHSAQCEFTYYHSIVSSTVTRPVCPPQHRFQWLRPYIQPELRENHTRHNSPASNSTQRVHVTIFKLVKQPTQSLIQLKSRHYGLITSPTLTYLICCMQKKGKKNN